MSFADGRVLIVTAEDDLEELKRRVGAAPVAGSGGDRGVVSASPGDGAEDGDLMPVALPVGTKVYHFPLATLR